MYVVEMQGYCTELRIYHMFVWKHLSKTVIFEDNSDYMTHLPVHGFSDIALERFAYTLQIKLKMFFTSRDNSAMNYLESTLNKNGARGR